MKKALLLSGLVVVLAACSQEEAAPAEETEAAEPAEATEDKAPESDTGPIVEETEESEDTGGAEMEPDDYDLTDGDSVYIDGMGQYTFLHHYGISDEVYEFGPMELTFNLVALTQVADIPGESAYVFNDIEKPLLIEVEMTVTNTAEEVVSFSPDMATIVTENGQQLESDVMLSTFLDSQFYPGVTQTANAVFIAEDQGEGIDEFMMAIDAPYSSESWEDIGSGKEITFTRE